MSGLRTALERFPAAWRFEHRQDSCIEAETVNPAQTIVVRIEASRESDAVTLTLLRFPDREFMADAQFPLQSWHAAKEFLESIALEAFVVGVDERGGSWSGSMILRSSDLDRRGSFSYVRSWLGTYDRN